MPHGIILLIFVAYWIVRILKGFQSNMTRAKGPSARILSNPGTTATPYSGDTSPKQYGTPNQGSIPGTPTFGQPPSFGQAPGYPAPQQYPGQPVSPTANTPNPRYPLAEAIPQPQTYGQPPQGYDRTTLYGGPRVEQPTNDTLAPWAQQPPVSQMPSVYAPLPTYGQPAGQYSHTSQPAGGSTAPWTRQSAYTQPTTPSPQAPSPANERGPRPSGRRRISASSASPMDESSMGNSFQYAESQARAMDLSPISGDTEVIPQSETPLRQLFRQPASLLTSFVVHEILSPPRSKRNL